PERPDISIVPEKPSFPFGTPGSASNGIWCSPSLDAARGSLLKLRFRSTENEAMLMIRRREFIAGLGGAAAAWPVAALAQQAGRIRRVGVLMPLFDDDPDAQAEMAALRQGLAEHGWIEGRTIDIAVRWPGNIELIESLAKELIELKPDVLL